MRNTQRAERFFALNGMKYQVKSGDFNAEIALPPFEFVLEISYIFKPQNKSSTEVLFIWNAVTIKGTDVVATGTILVFDITGRMMLTGNDELSIAELPSGIYVIRTGMGTVKVAR